MARYKLTIEYDGTRYNGWQVQKGEKTIQGAFFDACKALFGNQKFEFFGAGRTDGGVHAFEQVAHMEVDTRLNLERIKMGLNDNLPHDIAVLSVESAHPKFHARYDATARSYIYLISHRRSAFGKPFVWWIKDTLNHQKMEEAAKALTGFKDFKSFTDKDAETTSTKVELMWIDVHRMEDMTAIHIVGSHFLWKMVRRLTGVMVEAGRGRLSIAEIQGMFVKHSDIPAKLTAPSAGLYLDKVYYNNQTPERGRQIVPSLLKLR